jgi:hypothetical protein
MVCAVMDHGGNRKLKIVERRQWTEGEGSNGNRGEQVKQEIQGR